MPNSIYYVYALKDPTRQPVVPFYIGKGTGSRATQHLVKPDESLKGQRIRQIENSGHKVIVHILVKDLEEHEALLIEADLIAAFGTVALGGILTNEVRPTGARKKASQTVVVPPGTVEKAQIGLTLLKAALTEFARVNEAGISNADASNYLGLQSDVNGGSINFLSYSVLGILTREGVLEKSGSKFKLR